jgi:hypothetical protein
MGDRLLCVRYRYDKEQRKPYASVELIEDEAHWTGETGDEGPNQLARSDHQILAIRVDYRETELRDKIKAAGGIWRPRQKLWELRYSEVVALGLESRVVAPE